MNNLPLKEAKWFPPMVASLEGFYSDINELRLADVEWKQE